MKLVYIASPYTDGNLWVMGLRAARITQITAKLQRRHGQTHTLYSPIVHGHAIVSTEEGRTLPHTWDYWQTHDFNILKRCDELWMVMIKGWDTSRGMDAELAYAKKLGKPVTWIDKDGEFFDRFDGEQ